jgi:hypothetical protein
MRLNNAAEFDTSDVTVHTFSTETAMLNIGNSASYLEPEISMNIGSMKYCSLITLSSKARVKLAPDDITLPIGGLFVPLHGGTEYSSFPEMGFYFSDELRHYAYANKYAMNSFYQLPIYDYNYSYSGELLPTNFKPKTMNVYWNIMMEFHGAGIGGYGDNPYLKYRQTTAYKSKCSALPVFTSRAQNTIFETIDPNGTYPVAEAVGDFNRKMSLRAGKGRARDFSGIPGGNTTETFYDRGVFNSRNLIGSSSDVFSTKSGMGALDWVLNDENMIKAGRRFILFHSFSALVSDGKQFIDGINTSGKKLKLQTQLNGTIVPSDFEIYALVHGDMITQISGKAGRILTWGGQN